ncbi:MAG: pyridoxamine 5'-phosphate oxidase family protein [Ignavibacteriaceae bacterium]|nr:pyridoxamine 5'-phosphate oxidase family protein [Ignavibacteriaceae bacterium]
MNSKGSLKLSILLLLLFSSADFIFSQENESSKYNRDSILIAAHNIIKATRYCALITTGFDGEIHVRTMDPFLPEDEMTIWFGTNKYSRKVSEIKNIPQVTLYYAHPDGAGYVVINGKAQIVDDEEEKSKRWKEDWAQFYPERKKNYVLIKIVPLKMEVINYSLEIGNDPTTWQVPSLEF